MPVATIATDVTAAIAAHVTASNPHSQYFLAANAGTAASLNAGALANNVVQLDGSARLPAVDGSQLTGVTASASPGGSDTQIQYNNAGTLAGASGITRTGSGVLRVATRVDTAAVRALVDGTSAIQMQTAGGTAVFTVDTANSRLVIGGDRILTDRWQSSITNVFLGIGAAAAGNLTAAGIQNIAIGNDALKAITSGLNNCAVGKNALTNNTTGSENYAIGTNALLLNRSGTSNFAIGVNALFNCVSGSNNYAIGKNALNATTGSSNFAIGVGAGQNITSGTFNIALGQEAIKAVGTGNRSIGIGVSAGSAATNVSDCVFIGYQAGQNETNDWRLHIGMRNTKSLLLGDFNLNTLAIGFTDLTVGTAAGDFAPSSTSRASLRIRSGTLPSSASHNDGDIANDGNSIVAKVNGTNAVNTDGGLSIYMQSSTTSRNVGRLLWQYTDKTDATRKTMGSLTAYDASTEYKAMRWGANGGALLSFYDITTPIARQTLATGAGATVDQVITALQNLGLLKQS